MPQLLPSSHVVRNAALVQAEVDGEVVAMNIATGDCFSLSKVGVRVWALIAEPRRIGDLCDILVSEYDVDRATCEIQVLDLLADMLTQGLIETVQGTSA